MKKKTPFKTGYGKEYPYIARQEDVPESTTWKITVSEELV
jgi:hypothetical protein